MSSLHCKTTSSCTTCRRLWSSRSYLSFWKLPTPSIAHDENCGRKQPDLPSLSARTCAAKRQREGVCLTGSRARSNSFRFKKNEPRQDCSSTCDFLSCAGPRSSHQRQRFSTSNVVFYTWVRLQLPIHRPHPAERARARCCIDRYRLVDLLMGTSIFFRMFNEGSFKFFAIRIRSR